MSASAAARPVSSRTSTSSETESKDELITRLLAKAELAYKCCGFAPPGSKR